MIAWASRTDSSAGGSGVTRTAAARSRTRRRALPTRSFWAVRCATPYSQPASAVDLPLGLLGQLRVAVPLAQLLLEPPQRLDLLLRRLVPDRVRPEHDPVLAPELHELVHDVRYDGRPATGALAGAPTAYRPPPAGGASTHSSR